MAGKFKQGDLVVAISGLHKGTKFRVIGYRASGNIAVEKDIGNTIKTVLEHELELLPKILTKFLVISKKTDACHGTFNSHAKAENYIHSYENHEYHFYITKVSFEIPQD